MVLSDLPSALLGPMPDMLAAALVSSLATLALVRLVTPRLLAGPGAAEDAEFLIDGPRVRPLTHAARTLLGSLGPGDGREGDGPDLARLGQHLAADCPALPGDLEALVLYGRGFRHHCPRSDGTAIELVGAPCGGLARLAIRRPSEASQALKASQSEIGRLGDALDLARDLLDQAPVLAWSRGPDGAIAWANAAYRDRFVPGQPGMLPDHRIPDAFSHALEEVPLTPRGGRSRRRIAVPGRDGGEANWFEVSDTASASGAELGFALAADDLVAAEASLRRFVETLTETFAHLPIGLAVFDKTRRLGLFNPALGELVRIDAVWLAGRPSLRDFLERLRETRQMPEQKDFSAWRRKLTELEEGARDGTYEENWQLPSGKILRVSGRPHPQGALAFLFEDISTAIMLERRYRSELELSQATLDRMDEAVAVFDASGSLVVSNDAFGSLWGLAPMDSLDGPGVAAIGARLAQQCLPSTAWARLAEFTTAQEARTSWTAQLETRDGRALRMLVAPLPDASALAVFREEPAPMRSTLATELALAALRGPIEQQVLPGLAAALPTAPDAAAFQALGTAIQSLREALAGAATFEALAAEPSAASGTPLGPAAALLAARGFALDLPDAGSAWAPEETRAAIALALAATELAGPGSRIAIAAGIGCLTAAITPARHADLEAGAGVLRARHLVETSGSRLRIDRRGDTTVLVAERTAAPRRTAAGHA